MSQFAIAGLQLALPDSDNRQRISDEVARTVSRFPWVQMIVLPELATFGSHVSQATPVGGPAQTFYQGLARKHAVWIVPGSIYEREGDKVFNVTPVVAPSGDVITRYRKIFPFQPYERDVASGSEVVVFEVPGVGRFGISICYDQWFPELTRAMIWQGAEVIIHPTMTTTIDRDDELILSRANALTNQCFFFDVNNAGELGGGKSIVVGPEGDVLHQAGEQTEVMPLILDLDRVRAARTRGHKGLGQMLKSFRDAPLKFGCYNGAEPASPYLRSLGPLQLPVRPPGPLAS